MSTRRWVDSEIGRMPQETADDPSEASTLVEEFGAYGADVYLHRWGKTFALYRSGLEGENSEWVRCEATTLKEARAEAAAALDDLLDLQGLNFPPYMGLDNLGKGDTYGVPDDAVPVQRRTSFWTYGEMFVCELTVYRHDGEDSVRYLVADDETNEVIGEYDSLEAIDEAETLDEYEKLEYETEDIDGDE